jgi:hypothetical protein
MTPMSTATAPAVTVPPVRRPWQTVLSRALLVPVVLAAVFTVAVSVWAGGGWEDYRTAGDAGTTLLFLLWNLAPLAGMAVVLPLLDRWLRDGVVVLVVGVVALVGLTVWSLLDFAASDSSTAALVFLFLPLLQWSVVVSTALLAWALQLVLRSRDPGRA